MLTKAKRQETLSGLWIGAKDSSGGYFRTSSANNKTSIHLCNEIRGACLVCLILSNIVQLIYFFRYRLCRQVNACLLDASNITSGNVRVGIFKRQVEAGRISSRNLSILSHIKS